MEIKKYYSEEMRSEMLQLSDNHIDWDFGYAVERVCGNDADKTERANERYLNAVRLYSECFEYHYHVRVHLCGRSGRHVCVKDNAENRRRYSLMCGVVALMQKMIVAVAVGEPINPDLFEPLPKWVMRVHKELKAEINEVLQLQ